mmetsp:Transcript_3853/g.15264  ORF Transcript_3853/g.15264 Transcript_3853/m.15264 type:complete len:306 (-) Transcript_3853:48-965(-)
MWAPRSLDMPKLVTTSAPSKTDLRASSHRISVRFDGFCRSWALMYFQSSFVSRKWFARRLPTTAAISALSNGCDSSPSESSSETSSGGVFLRLGLLLGVVVVAGVARPARRFFDGDGSSASSSSSSSSSSSASGVSGMSTTSAAPLVGRGPERTPPGVVASSPPGRYGCVAANAGSTSASTRRRFVEVWPPRFSSSSSVRGRTRDLSVRSSSSSSTRSSSILGPGPRSPSSLLESSISITSLRDDDDAAGSCPCPCPCACAWMGGPGEAPTTSGAAALIDRGARASARLGARPGVGRDDARAVWW